LAIIFPESCRGVTSGALREIRRHGATTSCGGLFSTKFVVEELNKGTHLYFERTEPAGVYMTDIAEAKVKIDEGTAAIQKSSHALVESARDANKQMSEVTGKFRDGTEKLSVAIDKLMKVAERGDFAETVKLTVTLVDSLERLAVLEEKGLLDKVMKAMH